MNFLFFIIIPIIIGLYAQAKVSSAYEKYVRVRTRNGLSGRDAAEAVLRAAGIYDVEITEIDGKLTDHYDPTRKVLALSREIYRGTSIASVGVAAHEAGHAVQHKTQYAPLNLRMSLVPITNFASQLLPIVMLGGFFLFHSITTIYVAVGIYLVLAVFQLVTLPVEFDASNRAKRYLYSLGIIEPDERDGVACVLNAAAFTYVAAFVSSLGWLLYMLSMANNRR